MTRLTVVPATEIARQARVCERTLSRRIAALAIEPDVWMLCGKLKVPLFLPERSDEILKTAYPQYPITTT
jgi:hypothetical protein